MIVKYEEMKKKLEWTRMTLAETHQRLELHNSERSERIIQSANLLKERTDSCKVKLLQRNEAVQESTAAAAAYMPPSEDAVGLTDAERMLLQLCQEQRAKDLVQQPETEATPTVIVPPPPAAAEAAPAAAVKKDYAKTVLDLQMKLSSSITQKKPSAEDDEVQKTPSTQEAETRPEPAAAAVPEVQTATAAEEQTAEAELPTAVAPAAATEDEKTEVVGKELVDVTEDLDETVSRMEAKCASVREEDITMDLNETVSRMEAKCASVREELGQMAMSEQYMRTKQAQLLAKTREREAQLAMELAAAKEREAEAMRRKVTDMMKLLEERRNKLKMTEVVLQKKAVVVDKVHKILDSKERRANYVEQRNLECQAFDKKLKKED